MPKLIKLPRNLLEEKPKEKNFSDVEPFPQEA